MSNIATDGAGREAAIYLPVSKSSSPASPRPSSKSCLVTGSRSSFVNSACAANEAANCANKRTGSSMKPALDTSRLPSFASSEEETDKPLASN